MDNKDLRGRALEIMAELKKEFTDCSERHWSDSGTNGVGIYCPVQDAADLIEQLAAEPLNDPLTLEALRGLDLEPVYIYGRDRRGYYIATDIEIGLDLYRGGCGYESYKDYGKTWLAYRRKPDGGGDQ